MAKTLGWLLFVALSITLIISSTYMLFVPRAWLRLPDWFPSAGASFRKRYAGEKRLIGIRLSGAVLLAGVAWVVYDYFFR
jgi:hypothetical protein